MVEQLSQTPGTTSTWNDLSQASLASLGERGEGTVSATWATASDRELFAPAPAFAPGSTATPVRAASGYDMHLRTQRWRTTARCLANMSVAART